MRFHFRADRKTSDSIKKSILRFLKIGLRLRDRVVFVIITVNFERFHSFNLEANFLNNEILFQKTGVQHFS